MGVPRGAPLSHVDLLLHVLVGLVVVYSAVCALKQDQID